MSQQTPVTIPPPAPPKPGVPASPGAAPHRHHTPALLPTPADTLRSLASMIVVALFILTFILQPFRIPSESMERTLLVGDFLLVNKQIYGAPGTWSQHFLHYRAPRENDLVVFRFPLNPREYVVKRIIGVPGDRIHMINGTVYRNGAALREPYVVKEPAVEDHYRDNFPAGTYSDPGVDNRWWTTMHADLDHGDLVVPPGNYFVLGDNRYHSRDSRYWGFVPRGNIQGRPFIIYFSLRQPSTTDVPESSNDTLGHESSTDNGFARWDRIFQIVR